jgi:predicted GNAT superfamily acetyltransferase
MLCTPGRGTIGFMVGHSPSPVAPTRDLVEAAAAARRAAERADVGIRTLDSLAEFEAGSDLIARIWNNSALAPPGLLRALSHAGNFVAGAYRERELVGISLGFFGVGDSEFHLHSHITGVDPALQGKSLGYALKLFQRQWALEHGAQTIQWTVDPLVRRNVFFNLMKLGATLVAYHADFYGPMPDALNAGEETDRVVVRWDLTSPRSLRAANGSLEEATADGRVILGADDLGGPAVSPVDDAGTLLAWIPDDVVELRASDPDRARAWRHAVRETAGRRLGDGYRAEAMTRDGWLILSR